MKKIIPTEAQKKIVREVRKGQPLSMENLLKALPEHKPGEIKNDVCRLVMRGEIKINHDWKIEIGCDEYIWP